MLGLNELLLFVNLFFSGIIAYIIYLYLYEPTKTDFRLKELFIIIGFSILANFEMKYLGIPETIFYFGLFGIVNGIIINFIKRFVDNKIYQIYMSLIEKFDLNSFDLRKDSDAVWDKLGLLVTLTKREGKIFCVKCYLNDKVYEGELDAYSPKDILLLNKNKIIIIPRNKINVLQIYQKKK